MSQIVQLRRFILGIINQITILSNTGELFKKVTFNDILETLFLKIL